VAHPDATLFDRYRRSRAEAARDELVQRYLPLARWLTTRYAAQLRAAAEESALPLAKPAAG
jgi:DNA-directed RNA polymerase specialized sigma subunit